jgi:hypothetical protein
MSIRTRSSTTSKEGAAYVHADQFQPELQRFVAKRMGATVDEIDSSHVPMLSNPSLVIDVISTAANAVQRSTTGA